MTPSLKELALAAVEARKNYDKTDYSLNNEFFEWQKVKELFSISATPERILELEDKLERLGTSLQLISYNGHLPGSALADIARIALKSKEPSP